MSGKEVMDLVYSNNIEGLKEYLNERKNVNLEYEDEDDYTPVIYASYDGYTECLQLLLLHNANVYTRSNNGFTGLMFAAMDNHIECFLLMSNQ